MIYAIDAPAHGQFSGDECSAPLYGGCAAELARMVGGFHAVVAHSFGGFPALFAAGEYPHLVSKHLTTLATPGSLAELLDEFHEQLVLSDRTTDATRNETLRRFGRSVEEFSAPCFAARLRVDGLIVHDRRDRIVAFDHAEKLVESWPHARLPPAGGGGHTITGEEISNEIAAAILGPVKPSHALR